MQKRRLGTLHRDSGCKSTLLVASGKQSLYKIRKKILIFFLPLYFGVDHPPVVLADLDNCLPRVIVVSYLLQKMGVCSQFCINSKNYHLWSLLRTGQSSHPVHFWAPFLCSWPGSQCQCQIGRGWPPQGSFCRGNSRRGSVPPSGWGRTFLRWHLARRRSSGLWPSSRGPLSKN